MQSVRLCPSAAPHLTRTITVTRSINTEEIELHSDSACDTVVVFKDMSLRGVSKEALIGTITLGVVFVAGYFFGKTFKKKQFELYTVTNAPR